MIVDSLEKSHRGLVSAVVEGYILAIVDVRCSCDRGVLVERHPSPLICWHSTMMTSAFSRCPSGRMSSCDHELRIWALGFILRINNDISVLISPRSPRSVDAGLEERWHLRHLYRLPIQAIL